VSSDVEPILEQPEPSAEAILQAKEDVVELIRENRMSWNEIIEEHEEAIENDELISEDVEWFEQPRELNLFVLLDTVIEKLLQEEFQAWMQEMAEKGLFDDGDSE